MNRCRRSRSRQPTEAELMNGNRFRALSAVAFLRSEVLRAAICLMFFAIVSAVRRSGGYNELVKQSGIVDAGAGARVPFNRRYNV